MKTNQHGHALRNLTNRVMAVVDDSEQARAAVDTLEGAGVSESDVSTLVGAEGVQRIDVDGTRSGRLTRALRALQRLTVEGDHLRQYEAELDRGHSVIDVSVHAGWNRDTVVEILQRHGGHFINAYGQWTIENVAA